MGSTRGRHDSEAGRDFNEVPVLVVVACTLVLSKSRAQKTRTVLPVA